MNNKTAKKIRKLAKLKSVENPVTPLSDLEKEIKKYYNKQRGKL